jgi:hypothetical protein
VINKEKILLKFVSRLQYYIYIYIYIYTAQKSFVCTKGLIKDPIYNSK